MFFHLLVRYFFKYGVIFDVIDTCYGIMQIKNTTVGS